MKSSKSCELLDLDSDLPTTREDVVALRKARQSRPMDLAAYLEFLASLPPLPQSALRARKGPRGNNPFELP